MKKFLMLAALAATTTLAAPAYAQFAKVEDAIKYRQSALSIMGNHMGRLTAMARGDRPFDAGAVAASAKVLNDVSALPWEAFVPASNVPPSKFKGEMPKDAADIKELSDKVRAELAKLNGISTQDALRSQLGAIGQGCKACHDKFRAQ